MTNGEARDTAPAVGSFTLQHSPPPLRQAAQPWRGRSGHLCPKFSHHHLKLSLPHAPSPPTGRADPPLQAKVSFHQATPLLSRRPPLFYHHSLSVTGPGPHGCSVAARRRHRCSTPRPLSSRRRRRDSPGAADAPAQPGVPGPSTDARACAARAEASSSVPDALDPRVSGGHGRWPRGLVRLTGFDG